MTFTTLKFCVAAGALVTLSACAGVPASDVASAPPTVQLTSKERLIRALEANNCVLNAGNLPAVVQQATISNDELTTLIPALEAEGRAEVAGDGEIRILTDNCI